MNLLTRNELKAIKGGDLAYLTPVDDDGGGAGSSPKIDACKGKSRGDYCSWDYNGTTIEGKCNSHLGGSVYCSDLN